MCEIIDLTLKKPNLFILIRMYFLSIIILQQKKYEEIWFYGYFNIKSDFRFSMSPSKSWI